MESAPLPHPASNISLPLKSLGSTPNPLTNWSLRNEMSWPQLRSPELNIFHSYENVACVLLISSGRAPGKNRGTPPTIGHFCPHWQHKIPSITSCVKHSAQSEGCTVPDATEHFLKAQVLLHFASDKARSKGTVVTTASCKVRFPLPHGHCKRSRSRNFI